MAKTKKKPKKPTQVWTLYESKGELKRKNKFCPKCGAGTFLGAHKDRLTCGKCGYMEMLSKKDNETKSSV